MKEFWINVYSHDYSRRIFQGRYAFTSDHSLTLAAVAVIFNGAKLLYRIHVRLK